MKYRIETLLLAAFFAGLAPAPAVFAQDAAQEQGQANQIEALEAEKAKLEAFFGGANLDGGELAKANRRYEELGSLIVQKTLRWEELAERA